MQETPQTPMDPLHRSPAYWRRNLRVTAGLLAAWFVITFVVSWFARDLSFDFFGWPFSFWMGAQGALILYCVINWAYALYMERLDAEEPGPPADE